MNKAEGRALLTYFSAIRNEIEIDELRYRQLNLSPSQYSYVPRPSSWYQSLGRYELIVKLVPIFWHLGLNRIFFLYKFFRHYFKVNKEKPNCLRLNCKLAVAFAPRSVEVIESVLSDQQHMWISLPSVTPAGVEKKRIVDVNSLICSKDIVAVLKLSLLSIKFFKRKVGLNWQMQIYTAFEWFLIFEALKNTDAEYVTAEHFDRFAVLMDSIAAEKVRKLHLIQHGILDSSNAALNLSFNLPSRLSNVTSLSTYDKSSEIFFREKILSKNLRLEQVNFFSPKIELIDYNDYNSTSVLFVGYPACEQLHTYILKELERKYKFVAYYKPHPTEKLSKDVFIQSWRIIDGKNSFPRVDFLISYPSTLIKEYETHKIESVIHPIDLKIEDAQGYLHSVEQKLQMLVQTK